MIRDEDTFFIRGWTVDNVEWSGETCEVLGFYDRDSTTGRLNQVVGIPKFDDPRVSTGPTANGILVSGNTLKGCDDKQEKTEKLEHSEI